MGSSTLVLLVFLVSVACKSLAFASARPGGGPLGHAKKSATRLQLLPQIAFAATAAGAVFTYVYNNIDSIKEKQSVAIKETMEKQDSDVKAVKEQQRANLERNALQQKETLEKLAREAQERADKFKK